MDWAKVLSKTPLPTVLVVVGAILAMIAAARGLDWGNSLKLHLDLGGRIGLGLLGVVLCGAGFYLRLTGGKSSTLAALPEFTMIRLFPPDQPEDSKPWYEIGDYEFQRKLEFDADPVFDLRWKIGAVIPCCSTEWVSIFFGGRLRQGESWAFPGP